MPSSFERKVIDFLVAVKRVTVFDLAESADTAAEFEITFLAALLRNRFLQPAEISLAAEAVQSVMSGKMTQVQAQAAFELAVQRGITVEEAVGNVPTVRRQPLPAAVAADLEDGTRIGDLLVAAKLITEKQLETALAICAWQNVYIGEALVYIKAISRKFLANVLNCQAKVRIGLLNMDEAIFALNHCKLADVNLDYVIRSFALGLPARTVKISA